jgi:SM-20-related protein
MQTLVTDEEIASLGTRCWFVREPFAGSALVAAARREADEIPLRRAGMGRGEGYHLATGDRGDEIAWLDGDLLRDRPALAEIAAQLEALRLALNQAAYLGLDRFDLQLARYAPGGRYVRHRDAHRGPGMAPGRRVTAILYLNAGWVPEDGGVLRIHAEVDHVHVHVHDDVHDHGTIDLAPVGGRLVVFLSDRVEHEVLPSSAPRFALTAWYLGRS